MGLFNKKSKLKTDNDDMCYVTLSLNMRLMPVDRGALFEDPLDEVLHLHNIGEVTGGGTFSNEDKMPISCDIEFNIKRDKLSNFLSFLKGVNTIAKGSYIEYDGKKEDVGTLEGLNLILDGTNLDDAVYEENDINDVILEINNLVKGKGEYHSYYTGEKNTNLYFYGNSFNEMKKIIAEYTKTSPLCENSIIEKL